ncbi:polysaccharide biosynthesis protein [Flavisolibacter tropicus]|uniref:polysaccharide biosynthesis protein n=1 Tax=Flavisolibacter tropicus TaxID=1492898 RepID=UPI00082EC641|nr:nucleoside-diphosphate sugar epimerase/dehydratase [Flavisolibacter tropicus]
MERLLLSSRAVPRWVILLLDLFINTSSFALAYFIVKHFEFSEILRGHFLIYTGIYCATVGSVFYAMRIHTCLIRYSNVTDMLRIFFSVLISSLIYPVVIKVTIADHLSIHSLDIGAVLLVNFFIASSLLIMLRTAIKEVFFYVRRMTAKQSRENVLIFGSGTQAILLKQAIESSHNNQFSIAGFIDTRFGIINTYIQQKRVFGLKDLMVLHTKKNVTKLIVMNEQLTCGDKKLVIDKCLQLGIKVLTVPPSEQWLSGKRIASEQIKELKIEDLLQREPIVIDNQKISQDLKGKRILITGAAGSIGSEIVRQVLTYKPEMVILCDQAESAMHEIQLEVEEKFPGVQIKTFIGSIRDYNRIELPFKKYHPQVVFHAAAYKHVPMMEHHPSEAILTNIMGTKNVADLAVLYRAEKFVMVSTDKAVNPTNIMGATKRIAEMYVQSLSNALEGEFENELHKIVNALSRNTTSLKPSVKTKFITTRFGNVLGSNGSVVPRFSDQIKKGGPVTVTDPEITRFFMTIPEAVQLVLEAGTMGKGGEIYIFDMGKPVKVVDLARKMIQLNGFVPDDDIKIVFTGLRPGEKLYEELLNKEEVTLPTHHEKIKIAKVIPCSWQVRSKIEELINMCFQEENESLVRTMKDLVPEFISKNSRYEKLDKPNADLLPSVIKREGKVTLVKISPEGLPKTQP